jgi:hypothetical protein
MSRTACCFLALGISVAAFAAACGDDDDGGGGTAGKGGSGASGGSGGGSSAGSAGSGAAGEAGSGGTPAGGAGGGTAGTGNAGTGNGGSNSGGAAGTGVVETDGGVPDSGVEPDSGVVDVPDAAGTGPVDSGVNGDCPTFATATALCEAQNNQPVAIVRVTFNANGTGTVVLRGADSADPGGFTLGDIQEMCTGPDDGDCVDPSDFGDLPALLPVNAEVTLTNVPGLDATEGELVLATGLPSDVAATTFAYTAWGTGFTSEAPGGVGLLSWEDRALLDGFWTIDNRIDVGATQNTFICGANPGGGGNNGDTSLAAGFGICTADQF